jgi:predicted small lipoprotein YifL
MKKHGLWIIVLLTVAALLTACGASFPADLVSADNAVVFISSDSVAAIQAGTAYGDIITKLGATRDEGVEGTHTAVYLVDGSSFLYLSYNRLTDKCPQSGEELLEGLQSALGIRGEVTEIEQSGGGIMMLVEEDPQADMLMKAYVRVEGTTAVVGKDGESASPDDVRVGDIVEVVFDGPVAESYPLQGRALCVKIVE